MERGEEREGGGRRLRRVSRFCHAKRESRAHVCAPPLPSDYTYFFPFFSSLYFLLLSLSLSRRKVSPDVDPSLGKKIDYEIINLQKII